MRSIHTCIFKSVSLLLACTLCVVGAAVALAEPSAKSFLEQRHTEVLRMLRAASDSAAQPQRESQLDGLLGQLLDYEELSKRSLRDHWSDLAEAQRSEFVGLLRQLVQRSYRRNMQSSLDFQVTYVGETVHGEDVTVHTLARSKKNRRAPEVAIDYTLAKSGAEWRVFDVITDGVSMVGNYRSQFNRIIRKEGWPALIEKMRARLQDGADL